MVSWGGSWRHFFWISKDLVLGLRECLRTYLRAEIFDTRVTVF